jgi:hypothetical protein
MRTNVKELSVDANTRLHRCGYLAIAAWLLVISGCIRMTTGIPAASLTNGSPTQEAQNLEWMRAMQGRESMPSWNGGLQPVPGSPAGYYPGLEEGIQNRADYQRWYQANVSAIDDILSKTQQIGTGQIQPDCLGHDLHTCVATLAQTLAVTDYFAVDRLYASDKTDVNGNALFEHEIFIKGFLPGVREPGMTSGVDIDISLNDQRQVISVTANLPTDPFTAKTQEEYDQTGAYPVIAAMTRDACPNLDQAEVARFIENKVKSRAHLTGESTSFDSGITTANNNQASAIEFCGLSLTFNSVYGDSSDLAEVDNPHGAFGGMSIEFKRSIPRAKAMQDTRAENRPGVR